MSEEITPAFTANDSIDPRDAPQPAPGSDYLKVADSTTEIPLRPLARVVAHPIEVVARDRGISDVVLSGYTTGADFIAPSWWAIGVAAPSDPQRRAHIYRLHLSCSGAALFVPFSATPGGDRSNPGADLSRALSLPTAGVYTFEGLTGGWFSTVASGVLSYMLLRTAFNEPT